MSEGRRVLYPVNRAGGRGCSCSCAPDVSPARGEPRSQGSCLIVAHISRSVWVAWVKWVGCHAFGAPAEHLHPCGDTPKACPPVREPHAFAVILHGRCCFGRSAKAWHPRSPKDVCNDEGSCLGTDNPAGSACRGSKPQGRALGVGSSQAGALSITNIFARRKTHASQLQTWTYVREPHDRAPRGKLNGRARRFAE